MQDYILFDNQEEYENHEKNGVKQDTCQGGEVVLFCHLLTDSLTPAWLPHRFWETRSQ